MPDLSWILREAPVRRYGAKILITRCLTPWDTLFYVSVKRYSKDNSIFLFLDLLIVGQPLLITQVAFDCRLHARVNTKPVCYCLSWVRTPQFWMRTETCLGRCGPEFTPCGPESTPCGPESTACGPESTPCVPESSACGPESTPAALNPPLVALHPPPVDLNPPPGDVSGIKVSFFTLYEAIKMEAMCKLHFSSQQQMTSSC
jgi:hypothetical protein